MQGSVSRETHFRIEVTAEAFRGQRQPARHRMVYGLLREELEREGGLHALQLRTRTVEEEGKEEGKEKVKENGGKGDEGIRDERVLR